LDIDALLANQPPFNELYIRSRLQQYAKVLEMPELWDELSDLIKL